MKSLAKILIACIVLTGMSSQAADAPAPGSHRFSDLQWLTGLWRTQNGQDQVEEMCLPPKNNEILCTFTAITDAKVSRYELRSIREEGGRIIFQELAYGPGLQPDKPVPTRVVTATDATHIVYEGLSIERTGENTMTVIVQLQTPTPRTVRMAYTRVMQLAAVK